METRAFQPRAFGVVPHSTDNIPPAAVLSPHRPVGSSRRACRVAQQRRRWRRTWQPRTSSWCRSPPCWVCCSSTSQTSRTLPMPAHHVNDNGLIALLTTLHDPAEALRALLEARAASEPSIM
jgi:hypothetical protein